MQGNPCKSEFKKKSKSKQKHTLQGAFLFTEQGLALLIYIHVYGFITGISLFFEKQQHGNLIKQGKNVTKTNKSCY